METGYINSPMGQLEILTDNDFIVGIRRCTGKKAALPNALMRETALQLSAYFGGKLRTFDLPLRLSGDGFCRHVWENIRLIPYGTVVTYAELAERAGSPSAYRSAGTCTGKNPIPIIIPCHRVVAKNGLGGFGWGLPAKRFLLSLEGITAYSTKKQPQKDNFT